MRVAFPVIFFGLIVALIVCAVFARRTRKSIGRPVMFLLLALIPPMIGNLILIVSTNRALSAVGYYIYFLGMDFVMLALLRFTGAYCAIPWRCSCLRTASPATPSRRRRSRPTARPIIAWSRSSAKPSTAWWTTAFSPRCSSSSS